MGTQPGPAGVPAASPQKLGGEHPVFICYRQKDGMDYARWICSALGEGFRRAGEDALIYFDQTAPATSDWTAVHQPSLERACCLIVIITPGLKAELEDDDWAHKEIDWWLKHRKKMAPILVDTTGEGKRWIPKNIKSRWPRVQRVNIASDLWAQEKQEDRERIRDQVVKQIIDAIHGSRFELVKQETVQTRRLWRVGKMAAIVAVAAGVVYLVYTRTGRYQIDTIVRSAPVRVVAEKYQTERESAWAVQDYLQALGIYRPEEARRIVQQIVDPNTKTAMLISMAKGQIDAGQNNEAGMTLTQALLWAQEMNDPYSKIKAFVSIAESRVAAHLAEAGKTWEEAVATAQALPDSLLKSTAFASIAEGQARANQFTDADRTAQQITNPVSKIETLIAIAEEEVKANRMDLAGNALAWAQHAVQEIPDQTSRNTALLAIAAGQAKANQFTEAEHTANQIRDVGLKINALYGIVAEEAGAGQIAEAEHVAQQITDSNQREQALTYIATGQAKASNFTDAEQTVRQITNETTKNIAFYWIVDVEGRSGHIPEAEHAADQITEPNYKQAALVSLAESYAQANKIAEAERTLEKIDQWRRSGPRVWVVESQARVGHWKVARTTADLCPSDYRLRAYAAILNQYAQPKRISPKASLRQAEGDY